MKESKLEGSEAEVLAAPKKLSILQKYLALWIGICMSLGMLLSISFPALGQTLDAWKIGNVSIPIGICLFLMMYPALLNIQFSELKKVVAHPKPILVTLISNWFIVPPLRLLMTRLLLLGNEQLVVAILLGIAPCTAMVLVWGSLADGNQEQNFVNTSLNTVIIIILYAPLVTLYTGIQNIDLNWMELLISVGVFIGSPLVVGVVSRKKLVDRKGKDWFNNKYYPFMGNVSMIALLATLIVLFTLNGQTLIAHPDEMVLVSAILLILYPAIVLVNILITRALHLTYRDASIAVIIGSSSHFEIAISSAISLYGVGSRAALGTTMGLFWEVPTMLALVYVLKKLRYRKFYAPEK